MQDLQDLTLRGTTSTTTTDPLPAIEPAALEKKHIRHLPTTHGWLSKLGSPFGSLL